MQFTSVKLNKIKETRITLWIQNKGFRTWF
jgi:hypothetical protein